MNPQPPLSMVLQSARMEMLKAANGVMKTYGLPPCLMDGIVSGLLADIRAQVSSELVKDIQNSAKDGVESAPIADTGAQSSSESVREIQNSANKDGETENE